MRKKLVKEKKIDEQTLFDNAPTESDDYEIEAQVLNAQIKQDGVTNIGIVAPYGAGKSSAITTYLKRYKKESIFRPKHVQISLADFNTDEKINSGDSNSYSENAIERSILQQLLYSQKKHKLPKSSVNRTNRTSIFLTLSYVLLSIIFFLSITVLMFEVSGNSILTWLTSNTAIIKTVASCCIVGSLVIFAFCLLHFGTLRKIKYKDFEIDIDKNGEVPQDYSLFNNFINEVLYFFECVNVDLVIFEDLDRLENLKIFVKLRELNTIINNSPKRAKKVTFIYAVKDSMFKDEKQRAKFFEFILPIVPVINPITTYDNIDKMHKKQLKTDSSLKLSDLFIKDISFFVSDMRVLKNTFNDYAIMTNKLSDNREKKLPVKRENLFALALYKNLFPYDYSRLQRNEGLIPICVDKEKLISVFKKQEEDKIKELEDSKDRINKESLKSFNELKLLCKGQHVTATPLSRSGVKSLDALDTFEGVSYVLHPTTTYNGYAVQVQNLPNGESYYERELFIKAKLEKGIEIINNEIRKCKNNIENIESRTFDSLIREYGIEVYFSHENIAAIKAKYRELVANDCFEGKTKEKLPNDKEDVALDEQLKFIRMLINKNYLDENYLEYISNNKSDISLHDREFIRNVKLGYVKTYNYKLDSIKDVLKNLNEEDFLQPAILVGEICASLKLVEEIDAENDGKTHKFDNLMTLLSSKSANVVNAVAEFLSIADNIQKEIFSGYVSKYAEELIESLFRAEISGQDKDLFVKFLIKENKQNVLRTELVKSHIENHSNYLKLFKDFDFNVICEFIKELDLSLNYLCLDNDRDELFNFIVNGGYYTFSVDNLKIILNIAQDNEDDFEHKNYSFVMQSDNNNIKEQIRNDLQSYVQNVYLKLQDTDESESEVKAFILSEDLSDELKYKLIKHTNLKIQSLQGVDENYYETLLSCNKVIATWENIFIVYATDRHNQMMLDFMTVNDCNIIGSFISQDKNLQIKIFNYLLGCTFSDEQFNNLAKSVDRFFVLDSNYANNKNCEQFILEGRFDYNVGHMSILSNTRGMFPYLICYQDNIIADMDKFFKGIQFEASYMRAVLEEQKLSMNFKKEFCNVCGAALISIVGIEHEFATFLTNNNCIITEKLLYKFTNVNIDSSLKMGLLSLAVMQDNIKDLSAFKRYFQTIDEECSKLWTETKKSVIDDNNKTRAVVNYMKNNNMITFAPRKGKLYLKCS